MVEIKKIIYKLDSFFKEKLIINEDKQLNQIVAEVKKEKRNQIFSKLQRRGITQKAELIARFPPRHQSQLSVLRSKTRTKSLPPALVLPSTPPTPLPPLQIHRKDVSVL